MEAAAKPSIAPSTTSFFKEVFESSPDGILVLARDGCMREVNLRGAGVFGYSREELLGKSIEMLLPDNMSKSLIGLCMSDASPAQKAPADSGLELQGRRKDGSEFPAEVRLSSLDIGGERLVLAVVRNIAKRKRMDRDLRKSEERFRRLIEGTRDYAIFMLDPQGRVATWNPGAERIKGYRADEILGQHFSRFYLQEDIDAGKPQRELEAAGKEGRFEDETWRVRKDGSRFWASIILTALHGQNGELIGFSKVTRDFTTRRRAEDSLLIELSSAVLGGLDVHKLIAAIAASLHRVTSYDYAALALYDSPTRTLRVHGLLEGTAGPEDERVLPIDGTPAGWTFENRRVLSLARIKPGQFTAEKLQYFHKAGIQSACWVPLRSQDRVVGTLIVGSRREAVFDSDAIDTLSEFGRQIGVALGNVQAFQQAAELTTKLQEEKRYLEEELRTEYSFEEIVGESLALKRVLKQAETVAPTDATVLVEGETGTGKELIARAIHNLSSRRDRTFVRLNCSAIPLGLLESELFGHEKGAFTGAIAQRIGRMELAHMGTLFLDEIGDLPLELQPKILRALQEKEIERLGGSRTIPVDVRLIAATNRDLAGMVQAGEFRSDLYYRLKVFPIVIAPLRDRRSDIPLLVRYFVNKHSRRMNKPITVIPDEVMEALSQAHWPGNVRELENFIERAVILTQGKVLHVPLAELSPETTAAPPDGENHHSNLEDAEREHILRVLRDAKGVIGGPGGAAERLGVKRTTLNSKLQKLGIRSADYR